MAATTPDSFDSDSPLESPSSLVDSPSESPSASSPSLSYGHSFAPPHVPHRSISESSTTAGMTPSSTPLGNLNAARRPPTISTRESGLNVSQDILARIQAVHLNRQGAPPVNRQQSPTTGSPVPVPSSPNVLKAGPGGIPANFKLPGGKPPIGNFQSAPAVPSLRMGGNRPSLAEKRGMALPGGLPGSTPPSVAATGRKRPGLKLSDMNGPNAAANGDQPSETRPTGGSMMDKYAEFIDTKTGTLHFKGKAILNSEGVQFAGGTTFSISLDEVDTLDELGKGNYGTVYKVRHSRPRMRRPGLGLAGNKVTSSLTNSPNSPTRKQDDKDTSPTVAKPAAGTGVVMAMKELRLELDDAKFAAIIMELDVLHRCVSPYIIDFYGAFFQEGAVYMCIEFMDGGSVDKIYGDGVPENVLRKITLATTMGLKFLKEEHNIIHRDVKPTNILVNTRGQVKICDFGVSGNLVASIAKTNIGCQSYMAPERISSGGIAQAGANPGGGTYSVQSDIWSLGLTIIECAMGRYPYPPETYNNIFSQLSAIVDGEPPDLPDEGFSEAARNFVRGCLNKIPNLRPTYAMLLQHAWLAPLAKPQTIMEEDEEEATPPETPETPETNGGDAVTAATDTAANAALPDDVVDRDVALWVIDALDKKKKGLLGKGRKSLKPALHAAPLDAMSSPERELNLAPPVPS